MRCHNCGIENAAGSRFCNRCGTPLNKRCPKCGSEYAPEAIFCAQCGAAIDAAGRMHAAELRSSRAEPRGSSLAGERRHLTVLFCDLVNSTSLAAQLDPEEWREIVADYHRAAAQAIERYSGHVAQYLGDGVMAFFGYPEAHDNDAERAARAGLAILEGIANLNLPALQTKLAARVGIDSGSVVVGRRRQRRRRFRRSTEYRCTRSGSGRSGYRPGHQRDAKAHRGSFYARGSRQAAAQRRSTARATLSSNRTKWRAGTPRSCCSGARPDSICRARRGIAIVDESMAPRARRRRPGGTYRGRGWDRQIAPGAALPRTR